MKVGLTGVSGLVGGNVAVELHKRGLDLVGIKRASSKVDHLLHLPIQWHDVDLHDHKGLQQSFKECEVVIHCAASVAMPNTLNDELRRTNIDATRVVASAAHQAGVKRFIHTSSASAIGCLAYSTRPATEDDLWTAEHEANGGGYPKSKLLSEDEAFAFHHQAKMEVIVVNPSYMVGPYDAKPSSGKVMLRIAKERIPASPPGEVNVVDVRDVAKGMANALTMGRSGERYILAGVSMSYRELFSQMAMVLGTRPPRFSFPRWLGVSAGHIADSLGRFRTKPFELNAHMMKMASRRYRRLSSKKAVNELGYSISPIQPALKSAKDWFEKHDML